MSRIRVLAAVLGLAMLLTACSGQAPKQPRFNDADVLFAQSMIPHHRQALEMAELALDRAARPEVRTLAEEIRAAQDPEITTLRAMLAEWGAAETATGTGMAGMDHSGTAGMAGPDQVAALKAATGPAFDPMFLKMMIVHHEGAVADAGTVATTGTDPELKALAERIVGSQQAEIDRMRAMLAG